MERSRAVRDFISSVPGPGNDSKSTNGGVDFPDFVSSYCSLFALVDQDVLVGDGLSGRFEEGD